MNPKAELKIYADDVTASHGCTVGSLNKAELFYMKSRGLSEANARAFLQYAFAEKIIEEIEHPAIRELVETQLLGELKHGELIAELKDLSMFDLARVRDFPILSRKLTDSLWFTLTTATSQKPTTVIESISDYYDRYNSNVHRGVHTLSGESNRRL